MSPILKIEKHDERKELLFELKYLMSLTTRQRFEMMLKKSREVRELLEKSGHRKPFEVIKRKCGVKEELKILRNIKKMKKRGRDKQWKRLATNDLRE